MTAEKPNKRVWFQLHLSTCVVLMFVAGLWVFANTVPVSGENRMVASATPKFGFNPKPQTQMISISQYTYGWPLSYAKVTEIEEDIFREVYGQFWFVRMPWEISAVAANAALALGSVLTIALGIEYLIRRRARSRQDISCTDQNSIGEAKLYLSLSSQP